MMKLDYTTEKLSLNFYLLGWALMGVSIWEMTQNAWVLGVVFFAIGLVLVTIKSGIVIDGNNRRFKQYFGILFFRIGKWKSTESLQWLELISKKSSRAVNVLNISTVTTIPVLSLEMNYPEKNVEILSGKKRKVIKRATKIADLLQVEIRDRT